MNVLSSTLALALVYLALVSMAASQAVDSESVSNSPETLKIIGNTEAALQTIHTPYAWGKEQKMRYLRSEDRGRKLDTLEINLLAIWASSAAKLLYPNIRQRIYLEYNATAGSMHSDRKLYFNLWCGVVNHPILKDIEVTTNQSIEYTLYEDIMKGDWDKWSYIGNGDPDRPYRPTFRLDLAVFDTSWGIADGSAREISQKLQRYVPKRLEQVMLAHIRDKLDRGEFSPSAATRMRDRVLGLLDNMSI